MQKQRPKHLDLPKIRLPLPGVVSILHRISGAALFLALPAIIWLLQGTLSSAEGFECYKAVVGNPLVKLVLLGLLWAFMHHAAAGVRFLALNMHKGTELHTARATAQAVLVVSLALTVVVGAIVLFEQTWVRVISSVTVFALMFHAWVGIRDIWMDYVQPVGIRLSLHVLTILWLVGSLVYAFKVLWGV